MGLHRSVWVYRVVCAALLIVVAVVVMRTWRHWQVGQIDPASACIGVVALTAAVWAGRQGALAQRVSESDVEAWVTRLASAVLAAETVQRTQLLGGQGHAIDLDFVFKPAPGHNATGATANGSLEGVVGYYQKLQPQRLVITGAAGAGKTVLAVELILGLLAARTAGAPVPVRMSAAAWDTDLPIRDWLAAYLVQTFQLAPVTARALVDAGQVLPVIDGLDEMDDDPYPGYGSRAAHALKLLNAYQQGQNAARLVVTCRTGQYEALIANELWTAQAARVDLVPVTPENARTFIEEFAGEHNLGRWQPVLDALTQPTHPLADALTTPWRLTLAITVYQERHPDTGDYLRDPLALTTFTEPDKVRDHLLDRYIPAATAAVETATGAAPYPPEKVHAWLGLLAGYLTTNTTRPSFAGRPLSSTDLVLHELWPLAGHRARHMTVLLAFLIALVVAGLMLSQAPSLTFTFPHVLGASAVTLVGISALASLWRNYWPEPARVDLTQLKSAAGRRRIAGNLAAWLAVGLAVGLVGGLVVGLVVGLAGGLLSGLVVALAGALAGGLAASLRTSKIRSGMDPRDVLRADLVGWLALGLAFGLAGAFAFGLAAGFAFGPGGGFAFGSAGAVAFGLADGLALGLAFGLGPLSGVLELTGGQVSLRYIAFLLCVHKGLPWRLGAFLNWCYGAGLLRVAGIAYQFRHRELQDHLTAHPTYFPVPAPTAMAP